MLKITLKAARVNAGISQKNAAAYLGINNNTLCRWERGVSYPSAKYVSMMCRLYNIDYDDICFLPSVSLKENCEAVPNAKRLSMGTPSADPAYIENKNNI